jgi:DNA polymerase III delta prime subunit
MTSLAIHEDIIGRLERFTIDDKIPNIIFHGPSGSGKRTLVASFISRLYGDDRDMIRQCVLQANCAHGKGIKFVRDDLKFFAKANHNASSGTTFKSIVLTNADCLTTDAQSALRRCIEQFSHNTRFFIIVEDRRKLLKPILSRFSEICVSIPNLPGNADNLHIHDLNSHFQVDTEEKKLRAWLKKKLQTVSNPTYPEIMELVSSLYERGICGLDLLHYIEDSDMQPLKKATALLGFDKVKRDFRNEKLYMTFVLSHLYLRCDSDLENLVLM